MVLNYKLHKEFANKIGKVVYVKCIEEISELITALCEYPINIEHIAEEIADVYITIRRLLVLVNDGDDLRKYKKMKINTRECISILSRTQRFISKYYLYEREDHKVSMIRLLKKTYFVLDFLINKYDIGDNVIDWVRFKEDRDQNILDTNTVNEYHL